MPFENINRPRSITAQGKKALGVESLSGVNRLEVRNEGDTAHIYLAGVVGGTWYDDSGIKEKEVRECLKSIPVGTKCRIHINSEGGSVKEGLGIYAAFRERAGDCTAQVDGYALSIASVFPLACSKVVSPKSAIWMIHCASCESWGNAADMEQTVTMLREHDAMLVDIYAEHTGKPKKDLKADMEAETWIRGSKAVEYGLADEGDDETYTAAEFQAVPQCILDRCKNIPENILNSLSGGKPGNQKPTTTDNTMSKAQIVALLKTHGITALETETIEELTAKLMKIPVAQAAPAPTNAVTLESIQAAFNKAEKQRITDKVSAYIGKTITKDEAAIWVAAAFTDEPGTFKILDEKPIITAGGEPAGASIGEGHYFTSEGSDGTIVNRGKSTEKVRNLFAKHNGGKSLEDRTAIFAEMKQNIGLLRADAARQDSVRNENAFSASLTTNFLILGATTVLSPKFAPVMMFTRDSSVDPYKPLATGQLKFNTTVQDGSTTQTNATNFESGDSTVTNVAVSVNQYTEAFHLTNGQLNSGLRMEDLIIAKLGSLGSKYTKVLCTNITAANFATLAPVVQSSAAFGFSDMQNAWGRLKKANRKHIMLDGPWLAKLINIPTLFQPTPVIPGAAWKNLIGWDFVGLNTEWSAAGNNIIGFAADPQALGTITGLPLIDSPAIPGGILAQATGTLPGVDVPIAVYSWFNTSTRTYWASFDGMFGANALDTTAGLVIASGTPS